MILYVLCCLVAICEIGICERTKDLIYYEVATDNACFRRLNGTHQIGCASSRNGNVGVLHYIEEVKDLEWLINNGSHQPYTVLLTQHMFTEENVNQLDQSGKINGMLIIQNLTDIPVSYSPDTKCPDSNYELYNGDPDYSTCKKNKWNPLGSGFMEKDFNFPMVAIKNLTKVDFMISECYDRYNRPVNDIARPYPLCGAQILSPMDAIKDSSTCISRGKPRNFNPQKYCDPLGDYNVYSFLHPIKLNDTLQPKSVIVAAAKLDASGMFDRMYPGAETTVVGFITLLVAAEALGRVKNTINPDIDKPIMFSFFQGEAWDYLGSTYMALSMSKGEFPYKIHEGSEGPHPIHPNHIGHFLEVGQVALAQDNKMFVHSDPRSQQQDPSVETGVKQLEDLLSHHGRDVDLNILPTSLPLPPASLHSFLKHANFSGVLLSDYNTSFSNKYYNSYLDTYHNINYNGSDDITETESTILSSHISKVAITVARSLYELSTGRNYTNDTFTANETIVSQLLYCFFISPKCDLFNSTMSEDDAVNLPKDPYAFYVGINTLLNPVTSHTFQLLSYFTGTEVKFPADPEEFCKNNTSPYHRYVWMQGPVKQGNDQQKREGICMETTANKSKAVSPAFDDGYDWSSNKYPGWTESVWPKGSPRVRIFLIPDRNYEIFCLCVGFAMLILSMATLFFCNRCGTLLFTTLRHVPMASQVDF